MLPGTYTLIRVCGATPYLHVNTADVNLVEGAFNPTLIPLSL